MGTCDAQAQTQTVVVRRARVRDLPARDRLLRDALNEFNTDAFLMFFFQETTLQGVVLVGALAFIWLGWSAQALLMLPPLAAAVVFVAVRIAHWFAAEKMHQNMQVELVGYVAELRAPLLVNPAMVPNPVIHLDLQDGDSTKKDLDQDYGAYSQLIGTVSVAEAWGSERAGRVRALAVDGPWRRRGVGGALLDAARSLGRREGGAERPERPLLALDAVVSELQDAARALLHTHGWQCRGAYSRPLLGSAVTLQVAHFVQEFDS